jgi:hypothetical protein
MQKTIVYGTDEKVLRGMGFEYNLHHSGLGKISAFTTNRRFFQHMLLMKKHDGFILDLDLLIIE